MRFALLPSAGVAVLRRAGDAEVALEAEKGTVVLDGDSGDCTQAARCVYRSPEPEKGR